MFLKVYLDNNKITRTVNDLLIHIFGLVVVKRNISNIYMIFKEKKKSRQDRNHKPSCRINKIKEFQYLNWFNKLFYPYHSPNECNRVFGGLELFFCKIKIYSKNDYE